jgi:uncharacterized protein YyaL (SSP411 family)
VDIVLVGARDDERTRRLASVAYATYLPNRTLAWFDPADPYARDACALLADGKPVKDEPVAYVCKGRACSAPVTRAADLAAALSS